MEQIPINLYSIIMDKDEKIKDTWFIE